MRSVTPFLVKNDKAGGANWNFIHKDPKGELDYDNVNTAGDLAAAMELNPYLKVFAASGYYDALTPFFETSRKLREMPLGSKWARDNALHNLTICKLRIGTHDLPRR